MVAVQTFLAPLYQETLAGNMAAHSPGAEFFTLCPPELNPSVA
jgi:hypothetical protein